MHVPPQLHPMERALAERLPHLRGPQRRGLAFWVLGAVLAQSACQAAVLAALLPWAPYHALRQRLREWLLDGADKACPCAAQVDVERCFAPLLRWVLAWWQGRELALAVDATAHRGDVVALVVSVLYRGSAIPVAWAVLPGDAPGAWMGPILRLLRRLRPAVPPGWTVLVLADRALWGQRPGRGGGSRAARLAEGPAPDGHPGRGLDDSAGGALGGGHRPAARPRRGGLVCLEDVGRARFPGAQGLGLAVAALAPHRPGPGRAALAGAGRGEPVGAGARHPGRGCARAWPAAGPAARPARASGRRPPTPDQPGSAGRPVVAPPARAGAALASPLARPRALAAAAARARDHHPRPGSMSHAGYLPLSAALPGGRLCQRGTDSA